MFTFLAGHTTQILSFSNYDVSNIVTPIDVGRLQGLLYRTGYNSKKTKKLIKGFTKGFDLGYRHKFKVRQRAPNLKLTVGSTEELWNKVMKEVQVKCYAGPFEKIPFDDDYIQSPIGLVPKDNGTKTRLIFHLSYPKNSNKSVNARTLESHKVVKYKDFDQAVILCILQGLGCWMGKSDLTAAFRQLPLNKIFWRYLLMKAKSPMDQHTYYFFDKCVPFGAAVSCALFQEFSDALHHIVRVLTGDPNVNYLDDFFFVNKLQGLCQRTMQVFLKTCEFIKLPVSFEKMVWPTTQLEFLGLLIDSRRQLVMIPYNKILRALNAIDFVLSKRNKKITLRQLQKLCGYLNFLSKAIIPGRVFTRRLYSHGSKLRKPHHHLNVTREIKTDLNIWKQFLMSQEVVARPLFHFNVENDSVDLEFFTDASHNPELGCGAICYDKWFIAQWQDEFVLSKQPSIGYLELYAFVVGVFLWIEQFSNSTVTIFCDNQAVVHMINKTSSKCKQCMILLCMMVLHCMQWNVRLYAKYINTKVNKYADLLSRLKYKQFWQLVRKEKKQINPRPEKIPEILQDLNDLWLTE